MSRWTLWHNSRCSKSRAALERLRAAGVALDVIDYLQQPPGRTQLLDWQQRSGEPLQAFVRLDDAAALGLALDAQTDDATLLDALLAHPQLLQRPVVSDGQRVMIARPPEKLADWLP